MIALISALWILGGSATTHELAEWLEIERKSLRRLVGRASSMIWTPPATARIKTQMAYSAQRMLFESA